MSRPLVHIVKTDHNWFSDVAESARRDYGKNPEQFWRTLRENPHHYDHESIWMHPVDRTEDFWATFRSTYAVCAPYIECLPDKVIISPHENGEEGMCLQSHLQALDPDLLRSFILMEHEGMAGGWFQRRMPLGSTHIPFVLDYVSNAGMFDSLLGTIEGYADVKHVYILGDFKDVPEVLQ